MNNDLYKSVSFRSLCKEPVMCRYNYSENKQDYWIHPGRVYTYAAFMAYHFMKHLTDQFIREHENMKGMNVNNLEMRRKIWNKMLVAEKPSDLPQVQTLEQMAIAKSNEINAGMNEAPPENNTIPGVEDDVFEGLMEKQQPLSSTTEVSKQTGNDTLPPLSNGEADKPLTKDILLSFAVNELKMEPDEKLKNLMDKSVEEIAVELGYNDHKSTD